MSKIFTIAIKAGGAKYSEGSWWGNHTISRTIVDLNKILFYADKNGKMKNTPQRKVLIVADMIVSGEKEGPVAPSPKNVGIVASGVNPVCFDRVIAALMGFDIKMIPTLQTASKVKGKYDLLTSLDFITDVKLDFIPTKGWKGHIEKWGG